MRVPIILRLARRYIARRLLQSVLFIIGVAIGVAMVIAIDLANGSASRAFELSTQTVTGKATHQVVGTSRGLPTELYHQLRTELGLREIAPVVDEYVLAATLDNQPLRLLGVDAFAEPPFRSYLTEIEVAGENQNAFEALNMFIAVPNTALMSGTMAERFGVEVGDFLTIQSGASRLDIQVIGLLQAADSVSEEAIDNLLLADIATAQEIVGSTNLTRIDVILPADYNTAQIEAILPVGVSLTSTSSSNGALSQMTDAFELNLQALSLLALVVGVFLIYNTVTFSVIQRRPVLGVMRALGATRSQIFTLILGEAVVLGLVGTILGLSLGIIFGRGAVGLVAQTISDLYFTVNVQRITVDPALLLKGAIIGMVASIGAALLPSLEATRTPPAGSMRRSDLENTTRKLLPFVTLIAFVLPIIGVILLVIPSRSIVLSFTALFSVILGGALFTPVALIFFMRVATPITTRLFGVLGRMAPRAVVRSLSRTAIAVAALTISISVIVGVSVMIGSFRNTVANWLDTTLGADIYISPPSIVATQVEADVDPAIIEPLYAVDGIAQIVTGRNVNIAAPDFPDLPPLNIIAASDEVISTQRQFVWFNSPNGEAYSVPLLAQGDYLIVSEPLAFRRNISEENTQIRLLTDRGIVTFTVLGVYYDYSTDQGLGIMANSVFRHYFDDPYITSIALFLESGAESEVVLANVRDAMIGTEMVVQSNRSLREGVFEVFERTFAITAALRLLAVIVAFIGILSALMALQLEQTRQYGVMRAVGLTGRQLWDYTLIQTGLMGISAGILAMPIGLALAIILIYVINVRSFGWSMRLTPTPEEFILAFSVSVIAALVAGVYPAYRLTKLITARALRSE